VDVSKAHLLASAEAAGIAPDRAEDLWDALNAVAPAPLPEAAPPTAPPPSPKGGFTVTNVAYYFGGFLIIGAMTFFMTAGWAAYGAGFSLTTALIYAIVLGAIGGRLYKNDQTRIAGGVLVTVAVCMAPLAIYAFESLLGIWEQGNPGAYSGFYSLVHGSWIWMELGTIIAALVALRFVRFPLITLPIAFALWFLSMDCVSAIFGKDHDFSQMQWTSLWFGIVMLIASIAIDRQTKEDFAFWGYLYGTIAFYGGLTIIWTDGLHEALFALISLGAIVLSIILGRRVLLVFGTLGIAAYLGHLAFDVFDLSLLFPFVLTAIGLAIVAAGIWYQRNEARIRGALLSLVPPALVRLLPESRAK
jgi:hypothetical protein